MIHAAPPPAAQLVLVSPAEREVSFGRIVGGLPRDSWAVVVRSGDRVLAIRKVTGASFDFRITLPRREQTVRVTAYAPHGRRAGARVERVFGLPRSAEPARAGSERDPALSTSVTKLVHGFPGTSAVFVEDLVSGRGAAWNARAHFPAASTLKVAIAVEALRAHAGKPEPGSSLDSLLRRMLIESDNDAANQVESLFGGGSRVDALLRGVGIGDTWMGGGYLHGTPVRMPIPLLVNSQPSFGCCKYTSAYDLFRLFAWIHLAAGGRGPLHASYGRDFTPADARYLLYLLVHVPDRAKLGRFLAGGPYTLLHKAGWISGARHDAGLVYWPGGVFVAAVMTWGSGVGTASDVLAGHVAGATLARLRSYR